MHCPAVQIVAVPNAGRRGQKAMNQALREGMRSGFPDIMCFTHGSRAAFIEFKSATGRIDPAQVAWIEWLNAAGFPAIVCRDPDDGLRFLEANGFPFVFPAPLERRAA
jgi:hypothetical protein